MMLDVLLVEDNAVDVAALSAAFSTIGEARLLNARSLAQAIGMLRMGTRPHLVLCRPDMPDAPAGRLLQVLAAEPQWRSLPVLIWSNEFDPVLIERGRRAGVVGWVLKPTYTRGFEALRDRMLAYLKADVAFDLRDFTPPTKGIQTIAEL
jgi:CheY-like chemotaxis protein